MGSAGGWGRLFLDSLWHRRTSGEGSESPRGSYRCLKILLDFENRKYWGQRVIFEMKVASEDRRPASPPAEAGSSGKRQEGVQETPLHPRPLTRSGSRGGGRSPLAVTSYFLNTDSGILIYRAGPPLLQGFLSIEIYHKPGSKTGPYPGGAAMDPGDTALLGDLCSPS